MEDVHIIITGMVAIVPQRHGGVRVLLKDLSRGHHAHQAHLLAESARTTGRPPSYSGNHWKNNGMRLGVWTLHGDDIRILNTVEGGLHIHGHHMLRMREIIGNTHGAAKISRALYASDDPNLIAARLDATVGTLNGTWVHPTYQHKTSPAHGGNPGPRFIAEEACLNFQIEKAPLRLEVDRFNGNTYTLEISPNANRRIEVQLGNLPTHEIIFAQAPKDPEDDPFEDPHFPLYYDMCETPPAEFPKMTGHKVTAPLPDPPQRRHPHTLTMGYHGYASQTQQLLYPTIGKTHHGNTGSHNCPPTIWEQE